MKEIITSSAKCGLTTVPSKNGLVPRKLANWGGNVKAIAIVKLNEILRMRLFRFGDSTILRQSTRNALIMHHAYSLSLVSNSTLLIILEIALAIYQYPNFCYKKKKEKKYFILLDVASKWRKRKLTI